MKADFLSQLPRVSQLEEAAVMLSHGEIAAKIRAHIPSQRITNSEPPVDVEIRKDLALSHRLQAEAHRAQARYEWARGPLPYETMQQHRARVDLMEDEALAEDYAAARTEHEIATGAK